jgi:peptide/nickel transport system substrate-binding protein
VANQLAGVGIAAEIEELEPAELRAVLDSRDYDMALFAWVGLPLATERAADRYRSGAELNVGGYHDAVVNRQLSRARTAMDPDVRRSQLVAADAEMWDSLPNAPLYRLPVLSSVHHRVSGFEANPTIEGPLWNAEVLGVTD